MILKALFGHPVFWIVLVLAIIFIVYSGFKKQKLEKKNRSKRETEVKDLIKEYLRTSKNYKNITVEYIEVIPRSGKAYRSRDVFDVFVNIFNVREQKKLISKHAFEIEGVASHNPKSQNKKDVLVNWLVNHEFAYDDHFSLLKYTPPSRWRIYLRSLNKPNRRKYIVNEKTKLQNWKQQEKIIDKKAKAKTSKKVDEEQVFRPKVKKTSESL